MKMAPVSLIFTVLATYFCFANGQSACLPHGGGTGEWKSLDDCPPLLKILRKGENKTKDDLHVLKNALCSLEGKCHTDKVCCPDPCYTPDGRPGECVSIYSCPRLANLLKPPRSRRNLQYFQNSICAGKEKFSGCCELETKISALPPKVCAAKVSAFLPDPTTKCCGVDSSVGDKIVGGNATSVDQYPWLILIEYNSQGRIRTACGGSLISGRYVLTAAHCVVGNVTKEIGNPVSIRLGEYDIKNWGKDCVTVSGGGVDCTDGITQIPIEQIIPHPFYSTSRRHSPHDIALIRLQTTAPFTYFIRPICLPRVDVTMSPPDNFILSTAGWGLTATDKPSNLKMHVDLPYASRDVCIRSHSGITPWQICAGGVTGKDSCKGDSGGPLMYENTKTYELIGVVSYGPTPCGMTDAPGVYTKVIAYLPWIKQTIVA